MSSPFAGLVLRAASRPDQSDDDGWLVAACRLRSRDALAVEVLALGPEVEVLAPPRLREQVAALTRGAAAPYDG